MPPLAPLLGIKTAAVHRSIARLGPYLALAPARRRYGPDPVLIVDGTLVPTCDRTGAASSKHDRYSTNVQVLIDAATRLVVAVGQPPPGHRNDYQALHHLQGRPCGGRGDRARGRRLPGHRPADPALPQAGSPNCPAGMTATTPTTAGSKPASSTPAPP